METKFVQFKENNNGLLIVLTQAVHQWEDPSKWQFLCQYIWTQMMIYIYSLTDWDFSKTHSQANLHTPSEHKEGNGICVIQRKQ